MRQPAASASIPDLFTREYKAFLLWFGVVVVYGWVIMCVQPREAVWQLWCGGVYGLLGAAAMRSLVALARSNARDVSVRDPAWRWYFAALTAVSVIVGAVLGYATGQLGNWLDWNGWQVYMVNLLPLGAAIMAGYYAAMNLRGRRCLRQAWRMLRCDDVRGAVVAASVGLQYDLGQPFSRHFASRLRFLRGSLLLDKNQVISADDFRRLLREKVAPDASAARLREACERMGARFESAGATATSARPLAVELEDWYLAANVAEEAFDAETHRLLDAEMWQVILLAAALAYCFIFGL